MIDTLTADDLRFLARLVGKQIRKVERDRAYPHSVARREELLAEGRGDISAVHLARMRELQDKLVRLGGGAARGAA